MKNTLKILLPLFMAALTLFSVSCENGAKPEETAAPEQTSAEVTTEEVTTAEQTTAEQTTVEQTAKGEGQEKLAEIIRSAPEITAKVQRVLNIPNYNSLVKYNQGGYTDGNYWYQIQFAKDTEGNEENNQCIMRKVDMKTKKVVMNSKDIKTNHSNDILYNSKLDRLIVVHNNPHHSMISIIYPDTLEVEKRVTLPTNIYCMTYNENKDLYVVGLSGGQNFRIMSPEFKFKNAYKVIMATDITKGYTTQGCTCDDNFIYFVLYKENVVTVYDWNGKFVTLIKFDVGTKEPENISVVDGTIYIGVAENGTTVYKLVF